MVATILRIITQLRTTITREIRDTTPDTDGRRLERFHFFIHRIKALVFIKAAHQEQYTTNI